MGLKSANRFFYKTLRRSNRDKLHNPAFAAHPNTAGYQLNTFAILDLAPNDPTGNLPMTVPPEVREKIHVSLVLTYAHPFWNVVNSIL